MTKRLKSTDDAQPVIWGGRNQKELENIVKKLEEIEVIELSKQRSSRMLKKLKHKAKFEARLLEIQQSERGWFEDDDGLEL